MDKNMLEKILNASEKEIDEILKEQSLALEKEIENAGDKDKDYSLVYDEIAEILCLPRYDHLAYSDTSYPVRNNQYIKQTDLFLELAKQIKNIRGY